MILDRFGRHFDSRFLLEDRAKTQEQLTRISRKKRNKSKKENLKQHLAERHWTNTRSTLIIHALTVNLQQYSTKKNINCRHYLTVTYFLISLYVTTTTV